MCVHKHVHVCVCLIIQYTLRGRVRAGCSVCDTCICHVHSDMHTACHMRIGCTVARTLTRTHARASAQTHVHTLALTYTQHTHNAHAYPHTRVCVRGVRVHVYVHTSVCVCACVYVCMYICTCGVVLAVIADLLGSPQPVGRRLNALNALHP